MLEWFQRSALGGFAKGSETARMQTAGLDIRELPRAGKLVLRTRQHSDSLRTKVRQSTGQELPLHANHCTKNEDTEVLWLGPGKWLFLLGQEAVPRLRRQLATALSEDVFLLSDVSHAYTGIGVAGRRARALLSQVCALDLDTRSFHTGRCAQSMLARVPLLIHLADERPSFRLYVDRSFAHYAWDWLVDAASELMDADISP